MAGSTEHAAFPARRPLLGLLVALALLATACGGSSASTDVSSASDAAPAAEGNGDNAGASADAEPALVVPTVTGGQIDFASLEGQDVVLWFWAPW